MESHASMVEGELYQQKDEEVGHKLLYLFVLVKVKKWNADRSTLNYQRQKLVVEVVKGPGMLFLFLDVEVER